jgi:NADPH-dependent 2,4-dienoyl-CoA reductase/sulfur reductase-like enzyme
VGFGAPVRTAGFIPSVAPMRAPDGCIVPLAENIKGGVSIPVMVANKVGDVDLAEQVLRKGQADLIAMGRSLIADPYLPAKAAAGRAEDIVPCLYCGQGCIQRVLEHDAPAACTVNPAAGREGEVAALPAARKKNVVVVGGGPGGLTAARTMAERGHRVTLYEKAERLGGQMEIASVPPGKERVRRLIRHLESGARRAGVSVRSGEAFEPAKAGGADVLVLATGGKPVVPNIPGIGKPHVLLARDVLSGRVADPAGPVAIIGGGQVGIEVAEFLAEEGKAVAVVELLPDTAKGMPSIARLPLLCRLEELAVAVLTKARVVEIRDGEIDVEHNGNAIVVPAATVVIAAGFETDPKDIDRYKGCAPEVYVVGDAARPRSFLEAIAEGFEAGIQV